MSLLPAQTTQEQSVTISERYEQELLADILRDLKKTYGLRFAYDNRAVENVRLSVAAEDLPARAFLGELLSGSGFIYERVRKTYIIRRADEVDPSEIGPQRFNYELRGKVRDSRTGESLPFASVGLLGTSEQTVTTLDGRFAFLKVPNDTLVLSVGYLGYSPRKIRLNTLTEDDITVTMERAETYLPAVDIVAEMPYMVRNLKDAGHMELDPMNLRSLSNYGHQDLFKTIQFTPGISSNDGTNADLNIRGGGNDENLILWDGFTIYHLDHLFGVFSTINPEVVKNVQLYKSSYGAAYGGRSSGVLDVTGSSGDKTNDALSLTADLISVGVKAESALIDDKFSLLLAARRSTSDLWENGLYDDILNTVFSESVANQAGVEITRNDVDPNFYFYDINGKLDLELSDDDRLSLSVFHGQDVYTNSVFNQFEDDSGPETQFYSDRVEDEADQGNTGLGLVWDKHWSAKSYSRTSLGSSTYQSRYFFSKTERDSSLQSVDQLFESDFRGNRLRDITFRHAHNLADREGGELLLGYQYNRIDLGYTDISSSETGAFSSDSTTTASIHTIFGEKTEPFGEETALVYGGRVSVNDYTSRLYIEPRLRLRHDFTPSLTGTVAAGNYIQVVRRIAEQNIFLDQPDLWVLSDGEEFEELRSFHLTLSMQWRKKGWNIDIEPYLKRVSGALLNLQQVRLLSAFENREDQYLSGRTNVLGLDVFVQRTYRQHSGWVGYSYTRSSNFFDRVNDGAEFPSPYNKVHDLKAVYTYRYRNWEVGSTAVYATGYLYTPLLGTFSNPLGVSQPQYGSDLSAFLPDFFRWDANVSRRIHGDHADITLSLGVYNITDQENIRERVYIRDEVREGVGQEVTYRAQDLELLGFRPNFSLRIDVK